MNMSCLRASLSAVMLVPHSSKNAWYASLRLSPNACNDKSLLLPVVFMLALAIFFPSAPGLVRRERLRSSLLHTMKTLPLRARCREQTSRPLPNIWWRDAKGPPGARPNAFALAP